MGGRKGAQGTEPSDDRAGPITPSNVRLRAAFKAAYSVVREVRYPAPPFLPLDWATAPGAHRPPPRSSQGRPLRWNDTFGPKSVREPSKFAVPCGEDAPCSQ